MRATALILLLLALLFVAQRVSAWETDDGDDGDDGDDASHALAVAQPELSERRKLLMTFGDSPESQYIVRIFVSHCLPANETPPNRFSASKRNSWQCNNRLTRLIAEQLQPLSGRVWDVNNSRRVCLYSRGPSHAECAQAEVINNATMPTANPWLPNSGAHWLGCPNVGCPGGPGKLLFGDDAKLYWKLFYDVRLDRRKMALYTMRAIDACNISAPAILCQYTDTTFDFNTDVEGTMLTLLSVLVIALVYMLIGIFLCLERFYLQKVWFCVRRCLRGRRRKGRRAPNMRVIHAGVRWSAEQNGGALVDAQALSLTSENGFVRSELPVGDDHIDAPDDGHYDDTYDDYGAPRHYDVEDDGYGDAGEDVAR